MEEPKGEGLTEKASPHDRTEPSATMETERPRWDDFFEHGPRFSDDYPDEIPKLRHQMREPL